MAKALPSYSVAGSRKIENETKQNKEQNAKKVTKTHICTTNTEESTKVSDIFGYVHRQIAIWDIGDV